MCTASSNEKNELEVAIRGKLEKYTPTDLEQKKLGSPNKEEAEGQVKLKPLNQAGPEGMWGTF